MHSKTRRKTDAGNRERQALSCGPGCLRRFLQQERFPLFTVISLLLTLFVWELIMTLGLSEFDLVRLPGTVMLLGVGAPLNGLAGFLASSREEHGGLEVAVGGIMLWLVTAGVLDWSGRYW